MDKFLRGFISIEKALQIGAIVIVVFLLGYLGLNNVQRHRTPAPETSPVTRVK